MVSGRGHNMKSGCFCLFDSAPYDFSLLSCSFRLTQSQCSSPSLSELRCAPGFLHNRLVNLLQQAQCRPQKEHWWIHWIPPCTQRSGESILYLSIGCPFTFLLPSVSLLSQRYLCQVSAVASIEDDPEWYKAPGGESKDPAPSGACPAFHLHHVASQRLRTSQSYWEDEMVPRTWK